MRYYNGEALDEIPYKSAYNALLHVTQFFFELQIYKKISPKQAPALMCLHTGPTDSQTDRETEIFVRSF